MKFRRKQREMRTHAVKWGTLIAVVALCYIAFWGVQGALHVMEGWTEDLPSIDDTDFTNHSQESVMYAGDGQTLLAEFQLEKRDPVGLDQISPFALKGTIDTEDVRFYEHEGVDVPGVVRALLNNLRGGELEGASTITQQLVRNTVLSQEANNITFERKIREADLAVDLEKRYNKDEILLMYLNTINYGDGCYGIEAAAKNYFQVSSFDLTLTQAATLVGIPQSPTYLNPKDNPDACLSRRNVVLDRMLAAGDITQSEHDIAQAEPLNLNPEPEAPIDGILAYPYFTSYVRDLLLSEDNPYGCSYADLFQGGLTIYTSLDPVMQQKAESACAAQSERMAGDLDSALVAVETTTGQVKALVGGRDYYASQVNLATGTGGSGRQAGSTFKAFTLTAAIEQGISPQTLIDCTSPMTVQIDGTSYNFENFGGASYGIRTIQSATAISSNTGFLRLSQAIGQASTTEMAQRLGVTSTIDTVYSTTLGPADVTPLDMASAYATLATGGIKHDSVVVTKILDRDGNVIYEAPDTSQRVLDEAVASATTKVLRTVFSSGGTAYGSSPNNGQPVAGKTGTSSDFADHWLIGYSPSLSCATWIGNPAGNIWTEETLNCNALWQDFMSQALDGREIENFIETPDPVYNNSFNTEQKSKLDANARATEEAQRRAQEDAARNAEGEQQGQEQPSAPTTTDPSAVPNTVGRSFDEAASLLNDYSAGYIEEYSSSVPAGIVISQSVQDGQVVIVVSVGPKP